MLHHRKKIFLLLAVLLLIFSFIFILSLVNPQFHFFDIGIPAPIQNRGIALLSFLSICLVVYDLTKI